MKIRNVLKFGGTSVSSKLSINNILKILKNKENVFLVVSACSGITDQLLKISEKIEFGFFQFDKEIEDLKSYHLNLINELEINNDFFDTVFRDFIELVEAIKYLNDYSNHIKSKLISFGEIFSSNILYEFFIHNNLDVKLIEAPNYLKYEVNEFIVDSENIEKINNQIIITQGFVYSMNNKYLLMERGGSDFSASLFAKGLKSEYLEIWTDVDGIYNADPKKFNITKILSHIGINQLNLLAKYGAKVIYTETLLPAIENNIKIAIKNTFNLDSEGTEINNTNNTQDFSIVMKENLIFNIIEKNNLADSKNYFEIYSINDKLYVIDDKLKKNNDSFLDIFALCIIGNDKIINELIELSLFSFEDKYIKFKVLFYNLNDKVIILERLKKYFI